MAEYKFKDCRDCEAAFETKAPLSAFRCPSCREQHLYLTTSAHKVVGKALKAGLLVRQACETCGRTDVDAHHDDYSQPLSVRWLCQSHHRIFHVEEAQGFKAEAKLLTALRPLTEAARARVLAYVTERLATEPHHTDGAEGA